MSFESQIFPVQHAKLADSFEHVVVGGRDKFHLLPKAFRGIKQIGVIGWGSQGPAQAQNLRDSLKETGIKVVVGLQAGSSSKVKAEEKGFTEANGTLGEMFQVIENSDLVILLISDAAQAKLYPKVFSAIRPGATLGLSHGFLLGHMKNEGAQWPKGINVIGVCPKGMGPSVRRLYEQGESVNGAGINCSFAVEQDIDGKATDIALGWAVAIGAPYVFETTLEMEYRSDIFGERAILLGAVWGMVEALYREFSWTLHASTAYDQSVEQVTGPISQIISKGGGLIAILSSISEEGQPVFKRAYHLSYQASHPLLAEIYDEVRSGNEIRSVIMAGARLHANPMPSIETTGMWLVGKRFRETRKPHYNSFLNPITAGAYLGIMMAQVDLLASKGHCWSEICNESIIEAVDSLNPYMHAKGVSHMVDNCSITARLGTRKWGPRFEQMVWSQVLPFMEDDRVLEAPLLYFKQHPVHEALKTCLEFRPPVDIAVV